MVELLLLWDEEDTDDMLDFSVALKKLYDGLAKKERHVLMFDTPYFFARSDPNGIKF